MLNALIDWSLRNRLIVVAATLGFIAIGVLAMTRLPIDAFPDTTPVQVQINTEAPGLAPEEVERQITFTVEQGVGGLPGLKSLRSVSKFGLSQVVATFDDSIDIYFARQVISERLTSVEMPDGMQRPRLGPVATGLGEIFHYILTSDEKSLTELRTLQDWILKPALRPVAGVAEINGWGGAVKQYQVRVDPDRLLKYDVTFDQVLQAVRTNNLNVGGGHLEMAGEAVLVHGVGRTVTPAQIEDIVVTAKGGVPIRVRDVAEVVISHEIRTGGVTSGGRGEVVLGLGFMLMGENSHAVTNRLKARLAEVGKTLPTGVRVETVYDRTELVDRVLDTVKKNLLEGGLLVVAVLFIFLGNLRAGLIVATAIPLSMLFAFAGMVRFGIAGSLLSLGALDFGLVVDSSVVMIENTVRRLAHAHPDEKLIDVVRDAAVEVRMPTMFGELIIMIVYLPILTLEGVEGKLFRPMALTVIFALFGSLVLSLTLMPVLASLVLPRRVKEEDPAVVRLARWLYAPILHAALRHRVAVLSLAAGALVVAVMIARGLGSEFVPRLSEGALTLTIMRLPGTSLEESLRYNTQMEKALLAAFPDEVRSVWSRTGTAEVATDPMGTEETDFFIVLHPRSRWTEAATQEQLVARIDELFKALPGQRYIITQPIEQRVNEMISGSRGDIAVKLFGDDFAILAEKAKEIEAILKSVQGNADVGTEQLLGQGILQIRLRQDQLARYNVPARTVFDLIESLGGKPVGQVQEGQLRFGLAMRLPDSLRASPASVGAMLLTAPGGEVVPLSRLASLEIVEGPAKIQREGGQRRIAVTCNVRGRDLGSFVNEARGRIESSLAMPKGRYRLEWGGEFENKDRAERRLLLVVPAALALICVLLYITYHSLRDVALVFTAVPFGGVGGLLALWERELPFSISAGVGFIALSGVSVLNSMLLVTFIRQLRVQGEGPRESIVGAALVRLRPVLMTALVASLGFVPMAFSTGMGAEVQRPLSTVVIGGIVSSTLMTLVVLPVLYDLFGGKAVGVGTGD